jgi:hypothetical protein
MWTVWRQMTQQEGRLQGMSWLQHRLQLEGWSEVLKKKKIHKYNDIVGS